jgi:hypothetical protein
MYRLTLTWALLTMQLVGPFSDPGDSFFTVEAYKGAFAPGVERWTAGWTRLEKEL